MCHTERKVQSTAWKSRREMPENPVVLLWGKGGMWLAEQGGREGQEEVSVVVAVGVWVRWVCTVGVSPLACGGPLRTRRIMQFKKTQFQKR